MHVYQPTCPHTPSLPTGFSAASFLGSRRLSTLSMIYLLINEPLCVRKAALGLLIWTLVRSQSTDWSAVLMWSLASHFPFKLLFPMVT